MCQHGAHNEVTMSVALELTWLPHEAPCPFAPEQERRRVAAENAEAWQRVRRDCQAKGLSVLEHVDDFNARYGTPRRVREYLPEHPCTAGAWPQWYDQSQMIAVALGAEEPQWIGGFWWHDRSNPALGWVETTEDVARIPIPDWGSVPAVVRMLESRERWQQEHPQEPASGFGIAMRLTVTGGKPVVWAVNFPSFIDTGIHLFGIERFLQIIAGDPPMADALMDKFFALSTGYTEFLLSIKPEPFDGLLGFGGDATCMFSPSLYPRYGAAWDARLFEYARKVHGKPADLPCNLHSCGPSGHLYEQWGHHPCRDNIRAMQTRFLPGQTQRLRDSLPVAQLELTIRPPELDIVHADPAELQQVLWDAACGAGFRDLHLLLCGVVHRPEDLNRLDAVVRACEEVMASIGQECERVFAPQ
jgi:hypothetical protein